jgi:CRISPR/Cas system-associated exonuclease Cas4 (RecB family)
MIRLSPTIGLNLFQECPRCFWLHYNEKVQRPRGISPSLPGGMDLVIKKYFDQYRGGLPPELEGKVVGSLIPDLGLMNRWRNWRTGLTYHREDLDAELFGALDDCLIEGEYFIPLDYKTRGYAPKEGDSEKYYQTQLDAYHLLLTKNGYQTKNYAYLIYYYPQEVRADGVVIFNIEPVKINSDSNRVKSIFEAAVNLLRGPIPKNHSECEYCCWISERIHYE